MSGKSRYSRAARPAAEAPKEAKAADVEWPFFMCAAAVVVDMSGGSMGIRVFHGTLVAPDGVTARSMFTEMMKTHLPGFMIVDLVVEPLPYDMMEQVLISRAHAVRTTQ